MHRNPNFRIVAKRWVASLKKGYVARDLIYENALRINFVGLCGDGFKTSLSGIYIAVFAQFCQKRPNIFSLAGAACIMPPLGGLFFRRLTSVEGGDKFLKSEALYFSVMDCTSNYMTA